MARFEVLLPPSPPEQPHALRLVCEVDGDRLAIVDARGRRVEATPVVEPPPAPPPPLRSAAEHAREETLAALFVRTPRALTGRSEPADALGALLDLAREAIPCDRAVAWRAGASDGVLEPCAARGARAPAPVRFGEGIAGFCAQEKVCLAAADPAATGARAVLCAPAAVGNRVLGVLELSRAPGAAFDDGELAALAYLAHQAGRWLEGHERGG
jgi:hypothetical protein